MQLIYMMMGLSFGRTVERRSRDAITVDDFNNNFEQYGRPTTYAAYASPTNNDDSSLSREKRVVSQLYQNHKSRVHSVNQTLRLLRAIKKNYEHIYEQVPKRAHFNKKNSGQLRVCTNSLFHPKLFAVKILQSIILFFRENYITIIWEEHTGKMSVIVAGDSLQQHVGCLRRDSNFWTEFFMDAKDHFSWISVFLYFISIFEIFEV